MTAYNPKSTPLSDSDNQARQTEFINELTKAGYEFLRGYGTGDDWDPEPSLFVLDISRKNAVDIAARFGQHAILWGMAGEAAELIWC